MSAKGDFRPIYAKPICEETSQESELASLSDFFAAILSRAESCLATTGRCPVDVLTATVHLLQSLVTVNVFPTRVSAMSLHERAARTASYGGHFSVAGLIARQGITWCGEGPDIPESQAALKTSLEGLAHAAETSRKLPNANIAPRNT